MSAPLRLVLPGSIWQERLTTQGSAPCRYHSGKIMQYTKHKKELPQLVARLRLNKLQVCLVERD